MLPCCYVVCELIAAPTKYCILQFVVDPDDQNQSSNGFVG